MKKNAKIYVAGHQGLVGSSIIRRLQSLGYTNIITKTHDELDLTRQEPTEHFFLKERPEYVFLAAAKVGGILANMRYPAEFIYQNIAISCNVIHAAYCSGTLHLLNLGSSCIYPRSAPQPIKEEYLLSGELEPTNEPYAIAKIAALKMCRYYNAQHGTNYISLMPTNLYGMNDHFNLETSHVLPSLIRKFHLAKLLRTKDFSGLRSDIEREPLGFGVDDTIDIHSLDSITSVLSGLGITDSSIMLWGSGEVRREFLHVDELASACVYIMDKYNWSDVGEIINIGSGNDLTINEIATMVKGIVGFEGEISHDYTKPDGMVRKLVDTSRIQSLGWKPSTSLEEGIRITYAWYLSR